MKSLSFCSSPSPPHSSSCGSHHITTLKLLLSKSTTAIFPNPMINFQCSSSADVQQHSASISHTLFKILLWFSHGPQPLMSFSLASCPSCSPLPRPLLFAVHTGSLRSICSPMTVHKCRMPLNVKSRPAYLLEWPTLLGLALPSAGEDTEPLELWYTLLRTQSGGTTADAAFQFLIK